MIPLKAWEEMSSEEQNIFRDLPEETLIKRWKTEEGTEIIRKIIGVNFAYGKSEEYKIFIGTVKTCLGKKTAKIDLRGINFSEFDNLRNDEIFSFDFSNCALHYSNFSGAKLTSSSFKGSDILYSDFSFAFVDESDFSNTNLTLSDFNNASLEESDLRGAWISNIQLEGADLGFIKYNNKTDFHNVDVSKVEGSSNPLFISFVKRKHFLKHFKKKSLTNKITYYIWLIISDCGQSVIRWSFVSFIICLLFGLLYSYIPESFTISNGRAATDFTYYYYSVVTFTTLGFGDIVPNCTVSELIVTLEVVVGYIMLGGLISIFATKFIPND
jgi:hypothetical protein